jgi:hypothetical protein
LIIKTNETIYYTKALSIHNGYNPDKKPHELCAKINFGLNNYGETKLIVETTSSS